MDVFLMIRRLKTTIFIDAKESTNVYEIKRIVQGILKVDPDNQRLYAIEKKGNVQQLMEDSKTLSEYGYTSKEAKAEDPATIGLAIKENGKEDFEKLEITELQKPPELPDVMKSDDKPAGSDGKNESK